MTCFVSREPLPGYPSLVPPPTILRHWDGFCVLPACFPKVLLKSKQARVKFAQRSDICIVCVPVEEVEHGSHFFRVTPALTFNRHSEPDRSPDHLRERLG